MKLLPALTLMITLFQQAVNTLVAQPCLYVEDFSDDAAYEYFYYYYDITGACLSDEQSGSLTISAGKLNFNALNDANDTRYIHDLGFDMYDDFWTTSFDFTPTQGGTAGKTGTVLFALSEGDDNAISDTYSICEYQNTDAMMVMWMSDFDVDPDSVGFEIWLNDNGVVTKSPRFEVPYGVTYYLQFSRIATEFTKLDVFSDPAFTILVGNISCFDVPVTITGLNTLQHGNYPGGSFQRKLTASIDNICVRNVEVVAIDIEGPTTVCLGNVSEFTLITLPSANIEWDIPAGITYTGGATETITVTDWPGPGTYELTGYISYNCYFDTTTFTVNVIEPGTTEFIEAGFCSGENVTVDVTTVDATYLWFDGTTNSSYTFDEPGVYWVEILSGGCAFSDTITITEFTNPEIDLGNDITICGITNVNGVPGFEIYSWSSGANTEDFETSIPGIYTLTVTDENGCTASDEIELKNGCEDHVSMPNAFSPNADGVNDIFGPNYSGEVEDYNLQIFNRWGQLIFDTNKIDKAWDGTFEGEMQSLGTYAYVLTARLNNKKIDLIGNFTLVK